MEERIKAIYNDCWKIYKDYTQSHNMWQYNVDAKELMKKYGGGNDILDLLMWFTPLVNKLHEEWEKVN